jgi:hypothetical protein
LLGPVSPDEQMSLQFILPLRNVAGLQSFLSEVYDPASPLYHHYLNPSQFYEFYGPDPNEVAALMAYMKSMGVQFHVSETNPNVAEVKGTASQIQNALKTQIDFFSWKGQIFYSATSQAQLPMQFSNVQMIYGLENLSQQGSRAFPFYRTLGTVSPDQTSGFPVYYSPSEISQMYNATDLLSAGYKGTGFSIAIVDAFGDPYIQQELRDFCAKFGLPLSNGTLHIIPVGPYNASEGITSGWNIEIALDVEWAHAMAPNATINLYVASDEASQLFEAVYEATVGYNGTAIGVYRNNVISMSWGLPENDLDSSTPVDYLVGLNYPWLDQVFQMDAALGITAFASSGDSGAFDQTFSQTSPYGGSSHPATDPYVTGVGGTSLYMNTRFGYYQWPYTNATGTYGNETAWSWNSYYTRGTGGGWSTLFGQPSWQTGPGVVNNGDRGNPDVAWDADTLTGVLVSIYNKATGHYGYYILGGTSVGSPCWAGAMALIDQKAGKSLGFINPAIYSILNNPAEYSKAFHDVTVGNNNPNIATKGWDPLTGVGSPNLGELADCLAPTGKLPVVVTNDLSTALNRTYAYGKPVHLTAVVAHNRTISGPVTATITSSTGTTIASNIPMTYNASAGAWLGSYVIKPADPPGEWSATVTAVNASSSGRGYTTFGVGDGVTIVNPPFYSDQQYYEISDTLYIDSYAVDTAGKNVTKGAYVATFYVAQNQSTQNGLGKVEGRVSLGYDSSRSLWEGMFTIPANADQAPWIMVVNGTDLAGNKGSAYTWITVGLYVFSFTDLPTYVLGDRISISADVWYAHAYNATWYEVEKGTFTAAIYDGSVFVAKVPLTFSYNYWQWEGVFTTSSNNPTGFYTITVSGTDRLGNYGSFATVVRVAQSRLSVQASVSNPIVPVQDGDESSILAKVTYPDGGPMTVGNVAGAIYENASTRIKWFPMTYNAKAGGFVAVSLLHTVNATATPTGNYTVEVDAYDALGNHGNTTTWFLVVPGYRVSFVESGLPQGTQWSATFGGKTHSSTSNSSAFSAVNGVYPFSITSPLGYGVSPSSGSITVDGANVTEQITFIPMPINVSKTRINEGDNVSVNVTLRNNCSHTETLNVTIYGNQNGQTWLLYTFTNVTVASNSLVTLAVDGFGFSLGFYTITANAYPISGMTYISTSPTISTVPRPFTGRCLYRCPISS